MGGVLAIDYGERKCGFASTDALRVSLQALESFRHEGDRAALLAHVDGLLDERTIAVVLVGLPLHEGGRIGERARATLAFVEQLRAHRPGLDVRTWDEHLTTREAESRLREAGVRGRAARAARDGWSARVLLEDWLRSGEPRD
jgi:putative Holliday junction resolvase